MDRKYRTLHTKLQTWSVNLREAIQTVKNAHDGVTYNTRDLFLAEATLLQVAQALVDLYDEHELWDESPNSAADQCSTLYDILNSVGLPVA